MKLTVNSFGKMANILLTSIKKIQRIYVLMGQKDVPQIKLKKM